MSRWVSWETIDSVTYKHRFLIGRYNKCRSLIGRYNKCHFLIGQFEFCCSLSVSTRQYQQHDINGQVYENKTNSAHENGDYEYQPQHGSVPDGEYDQLYPFEIDGHPWQYQNHDYHHNSYNPHPHAPYKMHEAHDDCKSFVIYRTRPLQFSVCLCVCESTANDNLVPRD